MKSRVLSPNVVRPDEKPFACICKRGGGDSGPGSIWYYGHVCRAMLNCLAVSRSCSLSLFFLSLSLSFLFFSFLFREYGALREEDYYEDVLIKEVVQLLPICELVWDICTITA